MTQFYISVGSESAGGFRQVFFFFLFERVSIGTCLCPLPFHLPVLQVWGWEWGSHLVTMRSTMMERTWVPDSTWTALLRLLAHESISTCTKHGLACISIALLKERGSVEPQGKGLQEMSIDSWDKEGGSILHYAAFEAPWWWLGGVTWLETGMKVSQGWRPQHR